MSVFLVIPTLKQGGAERVISELANYFSFQGVDVHIVLLTKAEIFYEIAPNVTIHELGFTNKNRFQKIFSELQTFIKLRKLLKTYKPDCILSFMDKYNIFTIITSSFLDLKVFVSDRSNPKKKVPFSISILKKITYRYATGIVAQTSLAKDTLEKITGNNNINIIPNPVKEVKILSNIEKQKYIINIGRMVPEKGHDYLLKAFSKLDATDWHLVILGDGPLRSDLEKQVVKLGLSDKVFMPGISNDVDEWLAKSSIFVLSSISEGFPNSLVEAMAAGLPSISFDCDAGPRDIILDKFNGLLVEKESITELTDKLNILISDKCLAESISKNALLVRDKYNIQSIGSNYLKFILEK